MSRIGSQRSLQFAASCAILWASACAPSPPGHSAILLYTGAGTSPNDVAAIETILNDRQLPYSTLSARQLNAIDQSQLESHQLLIVPGGNYIHVGNGITPAAASKVHDAVQHGLNYF